MFDSLLLSFPLAAASNVWLRPLAPMGIGLLVGLATAFGITALWRQRQRFGTGGALIGANVVLAVLGILVAVAYVGLGWQLDTIVVVSIALAVASPFVAAALLTVISPKVAAVAISTTREATVQPLFWVALTIGVVLLLAFPFIPYNTFGEDIKMLKDSGLTVIKVLSILLALWTASISISDEIEGRTALTLLSKPISRRHFILGKFFGIAGAVWLMFLVLSLVFLVTISYKVVYDAREGGGLTPEWPACWEQMVQVAPGLILAFLEAVVLTSISVAISTRLPMLPNLVICSAIYVIGHLVPLLVQSEVGNNEIVRFMGRLFAAVLPVLDHFSIEAAISTGTSVPLTYLGAAFLYSAVYCTFALLGALILFEDRDLA